MIRLRKARFSANGAALMKGHTGADTEAVLGELGVDGAQLTKLREDGVI